MTTITIYLGLFLATTVYAALLARMRKYLEPDLTWLEIVAGVVFCLAAPSLGARAEGAQTWQQYEALVWMAFLIGGTPIVAWQLAQSARTRLNIERRIMGERTEKENGNSANDTAALASQRRGQPQADD